MPEISIIIPVFNTEKYLGDCFDSIINQTFSDFEVIAIDDGSTDKSGEICDEYAKKDGRFKVIHTENSGVSAARNKGLKALSGNYLCFIDSDDVISADFLSVLYQNAQKYKCDLSVCCCTQEPIEDYSGKTVVFSKNDALVSLFNAFDGIKGFVAGKLYNSRIIKENNIEFNESITLLEDIVFHFSCISSFRNDASVCFTDAPLYKYTLRMDSALTERGRQEYKESWFDSVRATDILLGKLDAYHKDGHIEGTDYKRLKSAIISEKVRQSVSQVRIMAKSGAKKDKNYGICKKNIIKNIGTYFCYPWATLKQKVGAIIVLFYPYV